MARDFQCSRVPMLPLLLRLAIHASNAKSYELVYRSSLLWLALAVLTTWATVDSHLEAGAEVAGFAGALVLVLALLHSGSHSAVLALKARMQELATPDDVPDDGDSTAPAIRVAPAARAAGPVQERTATADVDRENSESAALEARLYGRASLRMLELKIFLQQLIGLAIIALLAIKMVLLMCPDLDVFRETNLEATLISTDYLVVVGGALAVSAGVELA
jgi:hypothetical protein